MPGDTGRRHGEYAVKLVRGPFVRLDPHQEEQTPASFVAWAAALRNGGARLAADLFCGAGGLSLGLESAGWRVVLSADHDPESVETHRHHFAGLTVDWDLADEDNVVRFASLMKRAGIELLAGGPPCQPFSRAGRSSIRHRIREGVRDSQDHRRELWRNYMEVIRLARPKAVLMENVPDMALDRQMLILRAMVHQFEELGYAVEERVVETWRYGVPQFRQRLILVALAKGALFEWPRHVKEKTTVWQAIGDLPEVTGGWRPDGGAEGWAAYAEPTTTFQRRMRVGIRRADRGKVFDQITRPVRADDAEAFALMDSTTRYTDLPDNLKRYRDDIFRDKYKRLDEKGLSRTIIAHIAKDGYSFIHPRQPRTLTVREAARLQTFPDRFRFAGPPSAAFRQIGNAVPPLLGAHLGRAVKDALDHRVSAAGSTTQVAMTLAEWFNEATLRRLPWLKAVNRWQVVCAEMLLDRVPQEHVGRHWAFLESWRYPRITLRSRDALRDLARAIGRAHRAGQILKVAEWLSDHDNALDDDETIRKIPGVNTAVADLAVLVVPTRDTDSTEPVLATKGVLRVAARYTGNPVNTHNRLTDGRLAVARMIGYGPNARKAHLALFEISNTVCATNQPGCGECPLATGCHTARRRVRAGLSPRPVAKIPHS